MEVESWMAANIKGVNPFCPARLTSNPADINLLTFSKLFSIIGRNIVFSPTPPCIFCLRITPEYRCLFWVAFIVECNKSIERSFGGLLPDCNNSWAMSYCSAIAACVIAVLDKLSFKLGLAPFCKRSFTDLENPLSAASINAVNPSLLA